MTNPSKLVVAQLGARRNYAVPNTIYQSGMLERFYTDICGAKGWPNLLRLIPQTLQPSSIVRVTSRIPDDVPHELITAFPSFGFEYARRLRQARSTTERIKTYLWAGEAFGEMILKKGLSGTGVYAFNTAALEILQSAKVQGLATILEQTIAPYEIERRLLTEEQQLHAGWEQPFEYDRYQDEYMQREQEEWKHADMILCGSTFVYNSIYKCGGPIERCVLIPYGVDLGSQVYLPKTIHNRPLRVLTVGTVGLRKGMPYILEAAKRLKGRALFRMIGTIQVSTKAVSYLREHLELIGSLPHAHISEHYQWADVFLLPSVCEGSSAATYEALAHGLPVITTTNTGSIVQDNINGYVIPVRDIDAIVEKLENLLGQPELVREMSKAAYDRSEYGSLKQYSDRLSNILSGLQND